MFSYNKKVSDHISICIRSRAAYLYVLTSIGGNLAVEVFFRLALCFLQVLILGRLANRLRKESDCLRRGGSDGIAFCGPGGKGSDASLGRNGPRGREGGPQGGATKRMPRSLSIAMFKIQEISDTDTHTFLMLS